MTMQSEPPHSLGLRGRLRAALTPSKDRTAGPDFIDKWAEKTRQALLEPPIQLDTEYVQWLLPKMELWSRWFDAEVRGLDNIPDGPVLLVGNHSGGALTPDTSAVIASWYRKFGIDRPLMGLAFDSAFSIPGFSTIMRNIGMMPASHGNADRAFKEGASILVYPGGTHEAFRPWTDRNTIDFNDHMGFIRLALRQGVPIVPVTGHGGHESLVVLTRGGRMARAMRLDRLRLDIYPILFHLPWGITPAAFVGMPLPAKITVQVGKPITWSHLGPDDARDPERVRACYEEVTGVMQQTLDDLAEEVPHPLLRRAKNLLPDLRSAARTLRHGTRLAFDVPKMVSVAHTSPDELLRRQAARRPDALAIAYEDQRLTWSQVNQRVQQFAHWFTGLGVIAEDNVALVLDSRPELLFAMMALNRIGAAGALIHPTLSGASLIHALGAARPTFIVVGTETAEAVASVSPSVPVYALCEEATALPAGVVAAEAHIAAAETPLMPYAPRNDDTFAYIYTSGTTGLPKAAIVRNQRVIGGGAVFGRLMHQAGHNDVIYVPLPLFHTNPLCSGWGTALVTGASMAMRRRFSVSSFWPDVRRFNATSFVYIGEVCRYLLSAPPHADERNHRLKVAVGNGMSPAIWSRFTERFGIPVVREFYGSTEGNAFAMNVEGKPGMVGRLGPGMAVVNWDTERGAIARNHRGRGTTVNNGQTGLLLGRINPLVTYDGYLDVQATEAKVIRNVFRRGDAWFNTGDLITLHAGRWAAFADRVGDTFRWKGENVSTGEVGAVIRDVVGVADAVVYGVPVPGYDGKAGMVAVSPGSDFDISTLMRHLQTDLAPHQRPVFVRLLEGGPAMTETFKHQKKAYVSDGFNPTATDDELLVNVSGALIPLDGDVHQRITDGTLQVGG